MSVRRRPAATLSFHNLNYEISIKTGPCCCSRAETKRILRDVSGIFRPGMNAIMGPTGCGKTTLLDCIADRKDPNQVSGLVLIDGQSQPKNFKNMCGYVSQEDIIMGTLTVRENLLFSASLRLPKSVSTEEKKAKVEEVIQDLGMTKCADSKVGTEFIRGISGGERKRTNIGMEMITSPTVLFLDEPTTGLDAHTAFTVMELLQQLSRKGQTMIFSIHQPRYSIYKLFDTLMLLTNGEVAYHGQAEAALPYFSDIGYVCEQHNNPPDFFLDVLSGNLKPSTVPSTFQSVDLGVPYTKQSSFIEGINEKNGTLNLGFLPVDGDHVAESYVNHVARDVELAAVRPLSTSLPQKFSQSEQCIEMIKALEKIRRRSANAGVVDPDDFRKSRISYATDFHTQLWLVCKRAFLNLFRNPRFTILQILVSMFIAVVVGTIYFRLDQSPTSGIQNRVGAFFFMVMNMIFANLSSVEAFIHQRALFAHEKANGFYRSSAYFLAKFFCDIIPNRCIPLIPYSIISYWMIGLRPDASSFFAFLLELMLTSVAATSLCFAVSSGITLYSIANLCVTLCYVIMMIFSGLLVNLADMPKWLSWLKYISMYRYSLQALQINELKDMQFCENMQNGTSWMARLTT